MSYYEADIKKHICPECNNDLSGAVKMFGIEGLNFHYYLHRLNEVKILKNFIKYLGESGYGCKEECEAVLRGEYDFFLERE